MNGYNLPKLAGIAQQAQTGACIIGGTEPRLTEIPEEISRLTAAVSILEDVTSAVHVKLQPVRADQDTVESAPGQSEKPTSTVVGGELRQLSYRVTRAIESLQYQLRQVQL